jgi:hypothetical protein
VISDLRLAVPTAPTLVGYGAPGSKTRAELVTAEGNPPGADRVLHVYGLYCQPAAERLRWPLAAVVGDGAGTLDPTSLFLDRLVEVELAPKEGPEKVETRQPLALPFGGRTFLLPFDRSALDLPLRVGNGTPSPDAVDIRAASDGGSGIVVEAWLPLHSGLFVRATRVYEPTEILDLSEQTPRFFGWPDFVSDLWRDYFYYQSRGIDGFDLHPLDSSQKALSAPWQVPGDESRDSTTWWRSERPVHGLVANHQGRDLGLLVVESPAQPTTVTTPWEVSVDLGSTHTRIFRRRDDHIEPVGLKPRTVAYTGSLRVQQLLRGRQDFFMIGGQPLAEVPTQVLYARPDRERSDRSRWLPYDGIAVTARLGDQFHVDRTKSEFTTDIKWSLDLPNNRPAHLFLTHLLLCARAEAAAAGTTVSSVRYSYPSAFPPLFVENLGHRWNEILSGNAENGGGEFEAWSVAKYLTLEEEATPALSMMALDIGGSTSDIAAWLGGDVRVLDSVRFAAGSISAYLCCDPLWTRYCRLLRELGLPIDLWLFSEQTFDRLAPRDRLPMLHASLNALQDEHLLDDLKIQFRHQPELRPFLAHVSFVYGGLLYYLGITTRSLGDAESFLIHFCGKGATYLDWLDEAELSILERVFARGRKVEQASAAGVQLQLSAHPKREVGWGRLIDSTGRTRPENTKPRVCFGESGYKDLQPETPFGAEEVEQLIVEGESAVPKQFEELQAFVETWSDSTYLERPERQRLHALMTSVRPRLVQRLLGQTEGSMFYDVKGKNRNRRLIVDPIFLVEAKTLYEVWREVPQEIWRGRVPEQQR